MDTWTCFCALTLLLAFKKIHWEYNLLQMSSSGKLWKKTWFFMSSGPPLAVRASSQSFRVRFASEALDMKMQINFRCELCAETLKMSAQRRKHTCWNGHGRMLVKGYICITRWESIFLNFWIRHVSHMHPNFTLGHKSSTTFPHSSFATENDPGAWVGVALAASAGFPISGQNTKIWDQSKRAQPLFFDWR